MIDYLFERFVQNMISFRFYLETVSPYVEKEAEKEIEKMKYSLKADEYIQKLILKNSENEMDSVDLDELYEEMSQYFELISYNKEKQVIIYKFKDEEELRKDGYIFDISFSRNEQEKYVKRNQLMYISCLTNLAIQFEESINEIFKYLIKKYPDKYLKEKCMSYTEIIQSASIENIKEQLIDRQADLIMRENLGKWIYLIKQHNKSFEIPDAYLQDFSEIYYRRNIFVHNNGKINDDYIQMVDPKYISGKKKGQQLDLDFDYISTAIDTTMIVMITIFCGIVKCFNQKIQFFDSLFKYGYDMMIDKKWVISSYIFQLIREESGIPESDKQCAMFNYWLSQKKLGNSDILKEIEQYDTSALNNSFKICQLALLDKYEAFFEVIDKYYGSDIKAIDMKQWPIFEDIRKQPAYSDFTKRHHEDFQEEKYEMPNATNDECMKGIDSSKEENNVDNDNKSNLEK